MLSCDVLSCRFLPGVVLYYLVLSSPDSGLGLGSSVYIDKVG
jgi:hypothetical protein